MKNALIKALTITSLCVCSTSITHAITVSWGAAQTNGVADASGVLLPVGDLTLLGSFGALTPAQIRTASFATLQANFINYDVTAHHIGDGSPVSGAATPTSADAGFFLNGNDTNSSVALGLNGLTVYMWIFNATTAATATQEGIFTASVNGATSTIRNNWTFPSDLAIPNSIIPDIADVAPYTTGTNIDRNGILIGSFGIGGNNSTTGVPDFNLSPITNVPEPTYTAFLGVGLLLGTVLYRRHIKA